MTAPTSFRQLLAPLLLTERTSPSEIEEIGRLLIAEVRFIRWIATTAKDRVRYADREAAIGAYETAVRECRLLCQERDATSDPTLDRRLAPKLAGWAALLSRLESDTPLLPPED